MSTAAQIQWQTIGGTPVAVVEDHHHALLPWAQWSRLFRPLRLVTIDHHTDTIEAFHHAAFIGGHQFDRAKQQALVDAIDPMTDVAIEGAIANLRNDEHIDAAIRGGVIDAAFVIAEQGDRLVKSIEDAAFWEKARALRMQSPGGDTVYLRTAPRPEPPVTYKMPEHRMMAIDPPYYFARGEVVKPWPERAIESDHLDDRLLIFEQALPNSGSPPLQANPYILDIDMDAFGTERALHPDDPSTFHRLIAGAIGITIARERDCCEMLWRDEKPQDLEENVNTVLQHIGLALTL